MNGMSKKIKLKIHGTHCASCEVLIERKLKKIPGIEKVSVNFASGKTEVVSSRENIGLGELRDAIKGDGYSISLWEDRHNSPEARRHQNTEMDYIEMAVIAFIIIAAYTVLKQTNFLPETLGVTDNMSYGFIFLIGLVAALSTCLAVAGGLLLSVAAKYSEMYPNLTGFQKFKPTLYFNVGRVASYTILGGLIGWLGSAISLGTRGTGVLSILASLVMIILGFQMLDLFPGLRRFQPRMPKFIAHKIHDMGGEEGEAGAFTLGALTFFLPCGFTQALQLYVLAKGGFVAGALTMLAFSLGTLPMLMSLGAISSFVRGSVQKYFMRISALVVILLGFWNINNGLATVGIDLSSITITRPAVPSTAQEAEQYPDKQVVRMTITGVDYKPSRFIVKKGIPVEWWIDARDAVGCAQVISMPTLGIIKYLSPGKINTITFMPNETGVIPFSCPMGMTTRGSSFTVVSPK